MFRSIGRIFSNKSIVKKLLFTLGALVIYNFALYVQVPMVFKELLPIHPNYQNSWIKEGSFFAFLNAFSGGALQNMSIVALGVGPYITSSIIVQLLQMDIIPVFKKWGEEGELGKKKINQATRYIAIILAFVQALTMAIAFKDGIFELGVQEVTPMTYLLLAILITAGTSFLMWLGDQITMKGIGNGTSMIIVAGILISFPSMILELNTKFLGTGTGVKDWLYFGLIMFMFIMVIIGVIYIQDAVRKIPVHYSNRNVSSKDSNIPVKLNSAGVMPVIFAVTFLTLPSLVIQITDAAGWTKIFNSDGSSNSFILNNVFSQTKPIGFVLYVLLIFVFGIFYAFLQVSPEKIAENLQKQNAFIPGVRPGEETAAFISRVLFKVSLLGALFLVVIASLPIITSMIFTLPSSVQIGGTSILIVVGVAMETAKQIETELSEKTYKGFLR